ncbi:MAG: spore coat associated protein CotJA [Lachnospiraceae bacterium]|nr:spore coat associated protein CotJA [Lachnospiraceae bacterium]
MPPAAPVRPPLPPVRPAASQKSSCNPPAHKPVTKPSARPASPSTLPPQNTNPAPASSGGCGCGSGSSSLIPNKNGNNMPIGMAYVPWQTWGQTYSMEQGFSRGTLFPELDLPFVMGRCR